MSKYRKRISIAVTVSLLMASIIIINKVNNNGRKSVVLPLENKNSASVNTDTLINEMFYEHLYTFEQLEDLKNTQTIVTGKASSGNKSAQLDSKNEYSVTYEKKFSDITNYWNIRIINCSIKLFTNENLKDILAILSIDGYNGKNIDWQSQPIIGTKGKWKEINFSFTISDDKIKDNNVLKIYIWNKSKNNFFIDDLKISFWGPTVFKGEPQLRIPEKNISYGFEALLPTETDSNSFSTEEYHSGTRSFHFTSKKTYGPSIVRKISDVADANLKLITLSVWIKPISNNPEATLVVNTKDEKGNEITYDARGIQSENGKFVKGEWKKLRAQFKLPSEKIHPEDFIVVYLWNKSGGEFYADDLEIVFGEQFSRGGTDPHINTSMISKDGYHFERNRPPYQVKYLTKKEIGNNDGERLVVNDITSNSAISPFDNIVSGYFLKNPDKTEQLLKIENHRLCLFSYCDLLKKFKDLQIESTADTFQLNIDEILLHGDLNGDGLEEAIIYNRLKGTILILQFSSDYNCNSNSPSKIFTKKIMLSIVKNNLTKYKNSQIICGDFNKDGKKDLFLLNVGTDSYKVITFPKSFEQPIISEKKTTLIENLKGNENYIISPIYDENEKKDLILFSTKLNGINFSKMFSLNSSELDLIEFKNYEDSHQIGANSILYSGKFQPSNGYEYLLLNRDWKFDLNLLSKDKKGICILNTLDFTGFKPGQNPKYYECFKMVPGYYTQSKKKEVLVILRNCDDKNYSGKKCMNYSKDKSLPSSIQLYSF